MASSSPPPAAPPEAAPLTGSGAAPSRSDLRPGNLRVVFMGTPDFAVPTLASVVDLGCQVVGVVSQPDRPKGRGQQLERTPVAAFADWHGLPVHQWARLNNDSYAALADLKPDLCVVVAYGKILPQRYLDLPRFGCLNGHASLLPGLRGAAPIQWSVIRGHRETGTSIMRMEAGMDTGPVALMRRTPIAPDETAGALHDRLAAITAEAMAEAIERLCAGRLVFEPQDHAGATLAPMLQKADGRIDFAWTAQAVHDRVRGTSPWPGAFVDTAEGPLKILASRVAEPASEADEPGTVSPVPGTVCPEPGTVIAHDPDGPRVACGGGGAITLLQLQRAGRRVCPGADFLRGVPQPVGTRFGASL